MNNHNLSKIVRNTGAMLTLAILVACNALPQVPGNSLNEEMVVSHSSIAAELASKKGWRLITLTDDQGETKEIIPETEITLSFQKDRLSGKASCNNYFAVYIQDDNKLSIQKPGSTMMACPEEIMAQEASYLTRLGEVTEFQIVDGQLQLQDKTGKVRLAFVIDEPEPLVGGIWQLQAFNTGNALLSNQVTERINITFNEDGLTGFSGCNRYFGHFQLDADKLDITDIGTTRKFCHSPDTVMETEQGFLSALTGTSRYQIKGHQLALFDEKGKRVVIFNKQP